MHGQFGDGIKNMRFLTHGRTYLYRQSLPFFVLIVVTLFLSLIIFGSSRSFLVEARTGGMQISFSEGQNIWRLPNALLCEPLDTPSLIPDATCGQASSPKGSAREWILNWSENTVVNLNSRDDGGLEIAIVDPGGMANAPNGVLIMSRAAWRDTGALTFRASVIVGQDMQVGAANFLHDGRWEAREAGVVTSFFRSLTEVVKSGELSTGSKVAILADGTPAKVYGHVIPAEQGGLAVTMISELGNTALSIRHFGLDQPVLIEPDWVDVAISSPLLLAMAVIFSVLASISQIIPGSAGSAAKSRGSKTDEQPTDAENP